MDLMPGAMIFAQIVSLLGTFTTERSFGRIEQKQDFLTWLEENHHQALKQLLEANSQALQGIQSLLNGNQEVLLAKLKAMDGLLTMLAGRMEGFGPIALSVNPEGVLSEQAIDILRQCDKCEASRFLQVETNDSTEYIFLDHAQGHLTYTDARFMDDDLATLVDLGFLRQDQNSRGDPIFVFTRAASRLVRMIDHKD